MQRNYDELSRPRLNSSGWQNDWWKRSARRHWRLRLMP